ncbi:TPA: type II secretion system protein GspL [Escherichia coli]
MLEIYFPLCAADPIRWQRRTPDVEHGIWPDVADEYLQQWLQTDTIRLYIPGEWISVWQVELPDVPRKQIPTILPALLEEELNQDIDELHFAPLKIDQQLATVAVIHQQHMRNIAQWLQANGITRATVAPDWMSIPCGFMAGDAQRVICRIDECRGWSAGRALAPVMFRAQLNEQNLPISLTVVGIAPEELSAWAGADAERLTVTALPAITTYQGLFNYRPVKPIDTIIARALLETLIYVAVYILLMLIVWMTGEYFEITNFLQLVLTWSLLIILSCGVGLIFMVVGKTFPEMQKVLPILLKPLYFISCIMFPLHSIPKQYWSYLLWNPLVHVVELSREAVMPGYISEGVSLNYLAMFTLVTLFIGLALYRTREEAMLTS